MTKSEQPTQIYTESFNPITFRYAIETALKAVGEKKFLLKLQNETSEAAGKEPNPYYWQPDWAPTSIARFYRQGDAYLMYTLQGDQQWTLAESSSDLWEFVEKVGLHFARLSIQAEIQRCFHEPPDPDPEDIPTNESQTEPETTDEAELLF